MVKQIYFVRHGQSVHNAQEIWSGQIETPLTELGRSQAEQAAQTAKNLGIDHILSSPYQRALDTARIIAVEIGYSLTAIETNPLLVERHFGDMEGRPNQPGLHPDDFAGVESHADILLRARQALEYIQSLQTNKVLVVSHGSFGRALRHTIQPEVPYVPGSPKGRFANAEIVRFV